MERFLKRRKINYFLRQEFKKDVKTSGKIFDGLLLQANSQLLQDVNCFIAKALDSKDEYFPRINHQYINVASLILGLDAGDHNAILDLILNNVKRRYKLLDIARVTTEIDRKSKMVSMFEQFKNSNQLLVVVEQTEAMEVHVLGDLILYLLSRLDKDPTKQSYGSTLILFTKQSTRFAVQRMFGHHITARLRFLSTIVKDNTAWVEVLQRELMNMKNVTMILSPRVFEYIVDRFRFYFASIEDTRLIYNLALHLYYGKTTALLPQITEEKLRVIREEDPDSEEILRIPGRKLGKSNKAQALRLHYESVREDYDQLQGELQIYVKLLRDGKDDFPSSALDLLQESERYGDLARSTSFIDSVTRIRKFSRERLLKRIESSLICIPDETRSEKSDDLCSVLARYRDKIVNNDSMGDITADFIKELIGHATKISGYSDSACFFNDLEALKPMVDRSSRCMTRTQKTPYAQFFNNLTESILHFGEQINLSELYDEFSTRVEQIKWPDELDIKKIDDSHLRVIFQVLMGDQEQLGVIKRMIGSKNRGKVQKCIWL